MFTFKIQHRDKKSKARIGKLTTPHGIVDTPAFVPVGTQATVRGLTPQDLKEIGVQILFGNTYHLHLRPGEDVIKRFGGLGRFMGWDGPTITDSGGFQVFSLGQKKIAVFDQSETWGLVASLPPASAPLVSLRSNAMRAVGSPSSGATPHEKEGSDSVKITQDGVKFRSHIDGSLHMFTPEKSIKIQKILGADLILAFDECAPHPSTHQYTKEAMERTHEWASRCLETFLRTPSEESRSSPRRLGGGRLERNSQALYGIIQGGIYKDLREESAKFICDQNFDGIAIGGVSVGESKKEMRDALLWTTPFLPEEKPKHLLGIGEVDDIFDAVEHGMDTFDCVIPTRFGRYGIVFISPKDGGTPQNKFRLDLAKTIHASDQEPMTSDCLCYVCKNFKRGYVHHLIRANELLGYRLASYHNVYFLLNLSRKIREAIQKDRFENLKKEWLTK